MPCFSLDSIACVYAVGSSGGFVWLSSKVLPLFSYTYGFVGLNILFFASAPSPESVSQWAKTRQNGGFWARFAWQVLREQEAGNKRIMFRILQSIA